MEKRIFGYDVIRATAILLVMVGHTLGYLYSGTYSFFLSFLSGFLGVELFFVLSGVLIGKLLIDVFNSQNINKNLKNFLIRRWFRTLPMYFIMLLVYWFGNQFFDSVKNNDVALWKYFFFIQNFFGVQPTFFGVSWSLSVEEWFYVLFPLVLFIIKKAQPSISVKSLFGIGIFTFLAYFLLMRFLAFQEYDFSFYEGVRKIAFFRLDSIAFGILAAFGFEFFNEKIRANKYLFLLTGFVLIIVNQYIIFRDNYSNIFYFNTLYYNVLGIGLMMIFPFFKEVKSQKNFVSKGITFISKISYSLYLIHWLVFRFLELSYFSSIPNSVKFVLFFLISFAAAGFTYYFIEKPVMKFRDRIAS
ncbi:MAG: acyltransferase [Bergeyella sp.]